MLSTDGKFEKKTHLFEPSFAAFKKIIGLWFEWNATLRSLTSSDWRYFQNENTPTVCPSGVLSDWHGFTINELFKLRIHCIHINYLCATEVTGFYMIFFNDTIYILTNFFSKISNLSSWYLQIFLVQMNEWMKGLGLATLQHILCIRSPWKHILYTVYCMHWTSDAK